MAGSTASLSAFFATHPAVIHIKITRVSGSTPRDEDAEMLVARDAALGTIGGGQLEYLAISAARKMLETTETRRDLELPLGPEIGQCCGGRVWLTLHAMDASARADALARAVASDAAQPHVCVLGAGHIGRALADLFQHMPVRCLLIDSRADQLERCAASVETRLTALPEAEIRAAPPGSAFVVLTHDHALDFLLTAAVLERGDAAYVGMIGSRSKRAQFANWHRDQGGDAELSALHCPIGDTVMDKRPQVIAASVLAEVMTAFVARQRIGS
ncbi:xanthine dehydrogenase accessory protein XdhC [Palleronia caenipelagi]|uniref:Xanthine dehydrogenase accessory protein XdhC n=1 Tax=Palleronia caenipelagi TaxID=2489174 RepID=A0A547Q935_9RHOB|nr:xanthine dehydrogenase accessory protein XdhC [Palleronia caenipelagi]TRD22873.1 xanthine dehydrogenase accessory protein XdhC [Palleronia caenipelagi]